MSSVACIRSETRTQKNDHNIPSLCQYAQALDEQLCASDALLHESDTNECLDGRCHLVSRDWSIGGVTLDDTFMEAFLKPNGSQEVVVHDRS